MRNPLRPLVPALCLAATAAPLASQPTSGCLTNASATGNALTGRRLTTFRDYPALDRDRAFGAVLAMADQQQGVTVTERVPAAGIIRGEYREGGIRLHTFVYAIMPGESGGVRIALTHQLLPATAVRAAGWAAKVCPYLDGLTPGGIPQTPLAEHGHGSAAQAGAAAGPSAPPQRSGGLLPLSTEVAGALASSEDVHRYTFVGRAG